jgi:hypothetical protein
LPPQRATLSLLTAFQFLVAEQATGLYQAVITAIHTLLTQIQPIMAAIPERFRPRMVLAIAIHYDAPKLSVESSKLKGAD